MEEIKNEVYGNPNEWHITIYPKRAGDFGGCSISSIKYEEEEAKRLARDIEMDIKRHIDGVGYISSVQYDSWICRKCNNEFVTKDEAEKCEH